MSRFLPRTTLIAARTTSAVLDIARGIRLVAAACLRAAAESRNCFSRRSEAAVVAAIPLELGQAPYAGAVSHPAHAQMTSLGHDLRSESVSLFGFHVETLLAR